MYSKPIIRVLVLLCSLGGAVNAQAAERMENLGLVRVWVQNTSAEVREQSLPQALSEVVLRMTEDQKVLNSEAVRMLQQQAGQYLVSYAYSRPTADQLAQRGALDLSTQGLWLELRFEQSTIIELLRSKGVAVWGERRPRIILWWANQAQGQQNILNTDPREDRPLKLTLAQTAAKRAIPVVLPAMDSEDADRINTESVTSFRASDIRKASQRYASDATVVVSARRYGANFWEADWKLTIGDQTYWFDGQAQSSEELAVLVIEQVADRLLSLYARASRPDASGQLHLRIIDVTNYPMYQKIEQHLGQLSVIKQRHLAMVNAKQLDYLLLLDGSVESFENAVSLSGKLVPTGRAVRASTQASGDSAAEAQQVSQVDSVEYYWVGP